ncbi:MAG: antibiotic biosynthesis monooxygenase [Gammaproteobacteria bacterium]|nr:MAG: antibiotic biosynthesis monooxygenase [Gammaproteobacteria bacterium]
MNTPTTADALTYEGATVVITHRVRGDRHSEYEAWVEEIAPLCKASPGHLDWHMVRPIPGITETYTVIIRFDTRQHLQQWMDSETRARLIDKVSPLLVKGDDYRISSGLDFLFSPSDSPARVPIRWKQFLVTWSAIFPLVTILPPLLLPLLRATGLPENHYLDMLIVTGTVVSLMVYLVMPHYTRLIQHWLFK